MKKVMKKKKKEMKKKKKEMNKKKVKNKYLISVSLYFIDENRKYNIINYDNIYDIKNNKFDR